MGAPRVNRTALAALLLAASIFSGVLAHGHDHDPMVGAYGHGDLPNYSGGHHHAIPTTHVEEATRIESSPCPACLHGQRQRVAESSAVALDGIGPNGSSLELDAGGRAVAGSSRLPASRAPPRA